jgi:glucose-1-phosphate thymidylyltransferase
MKGIILAGGTGSRLMPLTKVTNKHLLPVGNQPMIIHPVMKLVEAGITEIIIITGPEHMGSIVNLLGSGKDYQCKFTYRVQDEAGGIAQALGLCEGFVGNDTCCVILGDNIFTVPITAYVHEFNMRYAHSTRPFSGATVLLKKVPDPGRYGVAEVSGTKIISIIEKPDDPKSDYAVTGIYFYGQTVFSIIRTLKPSGRGELEITDVNNYFIEKQEMCWSELPGEWTDAGTFPSLAIANKMMEK